MIKAIFNKSFIRDFIALIGMPRRIFDNTTLFIMKSVKLVSSL